MQKRLTFYTPAAFVMQKIQKGGVDMALSMKQEKFCLEYAKLGNARQAYINAGYKNNKESTIDAAASRLLSNVKVKNRLAELAKAAEDAQIADIQEMQKKLTEIIRQELTEEVIVVEGIGEGCSEARIMNKEPAIKDVINAITTLGKMQGAFIDKVENSIDISPIVIKDDVVK